MKNNYQKGFTLLELLVVIAIIGFMATIIVVAVRRSNAGARDARRISSLKNLQTAVELYYETNKHYPRALPVGDCCTVSSIDPRWDSWFKPEVSNFINLGPSQAQYWFTYVSDYTAGGVCIGNNGKFLKMNEGYWIYVPLEKNDDLEQNDGGIMPNAYELTGGDTKVGC